MTAAISVSGLVKDFGATLGLDHVDRTVRAGEVHGFLGPKATVLGSEGMLTVVGLNVPDARLGRYGAVGRRRYR